MWSAFRIRQDGFFIGLAQSFTLANSKTPIKSWVFVLNHLTLWSHWQESAFNSGRVAGRRIDGEKDVTSGRFRHFQFLLQMQLSIYG